MKNAGRAGIVPKDDFDINIKYKRLDAVMYDKSLYIAKKDVPLGTLPTDTTYWMKSICGNKEPIATTETAGIVKPDGTTITVDVDGTLHGNSEVTVDSELSKESENPLQNKTVAEELEKKLNLDGDSKDLTTTFTSNDSTNVTEWTDVGLLTSGEKHSSLFQKIATMFKNIRYLYHMLGTADISTLGDGADIGTVTGALSKLNSELLDKILNTNGASVGNIKFTLGECNVPCNTYDDVIKKYRHTFTVDKFTNFHNNTLVIIPLGCFDYFYTSNLVDCSIDGNYVTLNNDISTESVIVKVLMIQYDV